ncbi:MAG: hypothetical protein ACNA8R_15905, partial [Nitriliruptoraceae bacterium]
RILKISNATVDQSKDLEAELAIELVRAGGNIAPSSGSIAVTHQLLFTESGPKAWNIPQTVHLLAIDDEFIDGGDALVFPAFGERINTIRGPLTLEGGPRVGEERFLNDPFLLPGEINRPLADGYLEDVTTTTGDPVITPETPTGEGVIYDPRAFHFNALTGERPGFD